MNLNGNSSINLESGRYKTTHLICFKNDNKSHVDLVSSPVVLCVFASVCSHQKSGSRLKKHLTFGQKVHFTAGRNIQVSVKIIQIFGLF